MNYTPLYVHREPSGIYNHPDTMLETTREGPIHCPAKQLGKGLGLSAMKHPSLAPVNTTYRKIPITDYGSLTHTACAKTQKCRSAGQDWGSFLPN